MTDIILTPGRSVTPRQEWLGAASTTNPGAHSAQSGEPAALRLVGHKVLAQGAGRALASSASAGTASLNMTPAGGSGAATRALANFSQPLGDDAYVKGRYIDTYA